MDLIQLPFINAPTAQGQMEQLKSYLYQLSEQLNIQISSMESSEGLTQMVREVNTSGSAKSEKALSVFNAVKAMIIKSADIVNAYYEKIDLHLKGEYVAQSGFGDYMQNTELTIEGNSTSVSQIYKNTQTITYVDSLETHNTDAYIKTGLLYEDTQGNPVYGMEIGQKNAVDGVTTYDKSARFTSGRLSFYDANGDEVAYISGDKLSIVRGSISANSITSGTMSADRVRTGTLESVNSDVKIDLDNGVIGIVGANINENLVLNSCCAFHTDSSAYPCAWFNLSENAISGVTYTISANFTISGDIKRIFAFVGSNAGGEPFAGDFVVSQNPVSSGTYHFTFTANASHTPNRRIYIYATHISSGQPLQPVGGTCLVNWVKMEVGSQSTAWCPAKSEKNEGKNIILNNTEKNRGKTPFTYGIGYYSQSEAMVAGQTYKLTIDVNLDSNIKRIFCFGGNGTSGDGAYYMGEWIDYSGLSSGIYSLIFIASENNASSVKTVKLWAQDTIGSVLDRSTYCILNSIKLEKWYGIVGTISTPKNPTSDETDADLRLRGKVSFDSIRDSGSTIINGDNIKTGSIASNNYSYSSGNFSDAGSIFDLSDGMIRTKNLYTKGDALKLKGEINTESPVEQSYLPSQYSSSDIERINSIIAGSITPTTSDYNKYALWHDYSIDSDCRDCIQHLINGTSTKLEFLYTANLGDRWSGGNGVEVRATVRAYKQNGTIEESSRDLFTSGADGTYVKNLYADGIYTGGNNFLPLRYIKEQGTSNGWDYRKWSDGVLEQWASLATVIGGWASWGSLYASSSRIQGTFGIPFVGDRPKVTCSLNIDAQNSMLLISDGHPTITQTQGFQIACVNTGAGGTTWWGVDVYAIGRWN